MCFELWKHFFVFMFVKMFDESEEGEEQRYLEFPSATTKKYGEERGCYARDRDVPAHYPCDEPFC